MIAHAIDAPDHLTEWWGYSTFFVVVASLQIFLGLVLFLQPWQYDDSGSIRYNAETFGIPFYTLGIILAVLVVVVYIISRTTGLSFLIPGAIREPVTVFGMVPISEDIPLIFCLTKLMLHAKRSDSDTAIRK